MTGVMKISAAGMVCSLGHDMDTACAAARAGLTRLSEVPCRVKGDDQAPEIAVGHSVFGLTAGFEGDARLIRLHGQAARNLFGHPGAATMQGKVGWFLALPSATRRISGLDGIPDSVARTLYEEDLSDAPAAAADPIRGKRIIEAALDMAGASTALDIVQVSTAGQVGFAELVNAAAQQLEVGTLDAAVVGGVDSLVDEPELDWLNITWRLKTAEQPVGLVPGEAAALVLLTRSARSHRGRTPALANLHSVQCAQKGRAYLGGHAPDGDGLAAALFPFAQAQCVNGNNPWLVTDQNGECYRAGDWGQAVVKLLTRFPGYQNPVVWYPALSFGDTGAASAAVGTCMVLRAFARSYAPSNIASVVSSNDGPDRAALLVEKPGR